MKIGIVGKSMKNGAAEAVKVFCADLTARGYSATVFDDNKNIENVDVLIVFGGDGAILHAATIAAAKGIKIIGVNYGTLGFLTEFERGEETGVFELLEEIQQNKCRILKRGLLKITYKNNVYYALNEVALQRNFDENSPNETQILSLEVQVGDGCDVISGDGVLVSTPTGSTAYSLSAGGAILMPEVPAFLLTPVCAFSMSKRPMVFSDSETFKIRALKGKAMVTVDGRAIGAMKEADGLRIEKADFAAEFPVRRNSDFFAKIKNKLNK